MNQHQTVFLCAVCLSLVVESQLFRIHVDDVHTPHSGEEFPGSKRWPASVVTPWGIPVHLTVSAPNYAEAVLAVRRYVGFEFPENSEACKITVNDKELESA